METNVLKENEKFKKYDFKTNIYLHPDELKSLKVIYDNFTEMLSFSFTEHFKKSFNINYKEILINKLSQITKILRVPIITGNMIFDNYSGEMFFCADRNIISILIDSFLGGEGKIYIQKNEITEIEEKIIVKIFEKIVRIFENSLPKDIKFKFEPKEILKKIENFQFVSLDDLIINTEFEIDYNSEKGKLYFCFPSYLIKPIVKSLLKKERANELHNNVNFEKKYNKIKNISVDFSVIINSGSIKLKDIIGIQVGDCISLDYDITKPLTIKLGDRKKFLGVPGLRGKKVAVKIIKKLEGGENNG